MRYCCSNAQPPERRADPSPIATERSNGIRPKTKSGLRVTTGCKLLILKKINNTILQKAGLRVTTGCKLLILNKINNTILQ